MLRYTLRRLILLVPVLVGLSLLVFTISNVLPGDPVKLAAGPQATQAEIDSLAYCRARLGATDLLDDKTKAAIDTLTLALVAGSDKE